MKEIRLNRLTLRDFQGGTIELIPNGEDVNVYGENGAGKTRLFSAFTYLLFGKDSLNRADFSIKTLNSEGEVAEHGLQHTVEGVLEINGDPVTLKKVYSEKFIRARGRADAEFAGHNTQHFIDGVPKSEKEYKEYIQQIAGDEQTFRLLSNPVAFPTLPWQKRRILLLEIFGDVSDADIIASDPALADLPRILGKHKAEDYKKIIAARQAELNKALGTPRSPGTIETRIDEQRRSLPDVNGLNRAMEEKAVQHFEDTLGDARLRLLGIVTGGKIADLTPKLHALNADLRKVEDDHRSKSLEKLNRLNQKISELEAKLNASRRRMTAINGELKLKDGTLQGYDNVELPGLREKWASIDQEVFKDTITDTCPSCGQALPADRVQAARDKAFASFNSEKAERLKAINDKGFSLRAERDRIGGIIQGLKEERDEIETGLAGLETDLKQTVSDRDTLKQASEDFSASPGHADLLSNITAIEKQIQTERDGKAQDSEKINSEILAYQKELDTAKEKVDRFIRREQGERRIEELKTEEKKLAAEAEKLLSELNLIDVFTQKKVGMLNDKMTGHFEFVRWKLAEVQVNGGVNDQMCELIVNGIGYDSGLNSGARTQAGCDIIRTLQRHYDLTSVLWIDNRESVTELPIMDCQTINLVVSPGQNTLLVEVRDSRHFDVHEERVKKELDRMVSRATTQGKAA